MNVHVSYPSHVRRGVHLQKGASAGGGGGCAPPFSWQRRSPCSRHVGVYLRIGVAFAPGEASSAAHAMRVASARPRALHARKAARGRDRRGCRQASGARTAKRDATWNPKGRN